MTSLITKTQELEAKDEEVEVEQLKSKEIEDLLEGEHGPKIGLAETSKASMLVIAKPKSPSTIHWSCPRTLPHPSHWPQRPLFFRESATHHNVDESSTKPGIKIDLETINFETDLFKGSVIVRVRGRKNSESYFSGRNRLSSFVITGQFKKELPFSEVMTGQEFCHPIKTPNFVVSKTILNFFRLLAPLLKAQFSTDSAYFLSPLAQTVQVLNVSEEPLPLTRAMDVPEETKLLGGDFAKGLTNSKRKKLLSSSKKLAKYNFNTEHYYTFDFYNDKLDLETLELVVLKKRYSLQKYLNGQPLRILSRVMSNGVDSPYLWNFELWHENQTKNMQKI